MPLYSTFSVSVVGFSFFAVIRFFSLNVFCMGDTQRILHCV